MSSAGTYDSDELRALAVALDVLDPEDPDGWEGDADAFRASVAVGRERLERRGVATFARDGGAEVDPAEAGMLRAFLAPDAVIEAWVVDGSVALQREWYVGPEVTVVADPSAEGSEQQLTMIETPAAFSDVIAFLELRGVDADGDPVRIDGDAIDDFKGRPPGAPTSVQSAARLMNVTAAWERGASAREVQLLDAGLGGLWFAVAVERGYTTVGDAAGSPVDLVDMIPTTWKTAVERVLAVVCSAPAA